jgi:hypothetical protein
LTHPVKVIKAFGITRQATVILFKVDDANNFKSRLEAMRAAG